MLYKNIKILNLDDPTVKAMIEMKTWRIRRSGDDDTAGLEIFKTSFDVEEREEFGVKFYLTPYHGILLNRTPYEINMAACNNYNNMLKEDVIIIVKDFYDSLSDDLKEFVVLHEKGHKVLNHCERGVKDKNGDLKRNKMFECEADSYALDKHSSSNKSELINSFVKSLKEWKKHVNSNYCNIVLSAYGIVTSENINHWRTKLVSLIFGITRIGKGSTFEICFRERSLRYHLKCKNQDFLNNRLG